MPYPYHFPPGFAETMTQREIAMIYQPLDAEINWMAQNLLEITAERGFVQRIHSVADTAALALRAMEVNVGGTLPIFDELDPYNRHKAPVGKTKVIESADLFVIVGGPVICDNSRRFMSILHRAATVNEIDSSVRTRLAGNDFSVIETIAA